MSTAPKFGGEVGLCSIGNHWLLPPVNGRRSLLLNIHLSSGGYFHYTSGVTTTATTAAPPVDQADADQEIITRVLAGSKDAFGILIQRYSDPLYRHALGMTGSPDVAEDILQASFIKAYQHLGEVRGRFDAWVFRIVANACKDWLKNIRRTHVSYEEDDQPSSFSTPEEEMDRNELRTDLEYALGRLPESLREAFVMKHVEGRSYEEMAELLETTVGALKMRVHRAREALQALLEEKYS
jgi:RNA polymerase sigma-70 factor (ECF subfamily)